MTSSSNLSITPSAYKDLVKDVVNIHSQIINKNFTEVKKNIKVLENSNLPQDIVKTLQSLGELVSNNQINKALKVLSKLESALLFINPSLISPSSHHFDSAANYYFSEQIDSALEETAMLSFSDHILSHKPLPQCMFHAHNLSWLLFFGPLSDKMDDCKKAAMENDPSYFEWLQLGTILLIAKSYNSKSNLLPLEPLTDSHLPVLKELAPAIKCVDIELVFQLLWMQATNQEWPNLSEVETAKYEEIAKWVTSLRQCFYHLDRAQLNQLLTH